MSRHLSRPRRRVMLGAQIRRYAARRAADPQRSVPVIQTLREQRAVELAEQGLPNEQASVRRAVIAERDA